MSPKLNLIEKILAHAVVGSDPLDHVGQTILIRADWVITSELAWATMSKTYDELGRPPLPRPERFWLAADHAVDPRVNHLPKVRKFIELAEDIASREKGIDYQPPNTTILHTDFCRERVQPGQVVIGADSHTCSAGCLGAFAMGLGSTDVTLALLTGATWIKVPETVRIELVGRPPLNIGGKDVILHILGKLKRNTVATERAVEFGGPGLAYLSVDARFAICNMTTEFGGIAGVCEPDAIALDYIHSRVAPHHRDESILFRPDAGATYSATYTIDLAEVSSLIALYPNPDDVAPAIELEQAGKLQHLDGVFIGACTTAYTDLVLGAFVLEAGFKQGMQVAEHGKRKVTPGSLRIIELLKKHGLIELYERAGFEIGVPGCSYCVGMSADIAGEGEVWLSSQNRNFANRMGKGAIGNLASAATVAASSFEMRLRDPGFLLARVDVKRFAKICGNGDAMELANEPTFSEPQPSGKRYGAQAPEGASLTKGPLPTLAPVKARYQRFGDNVDTDAITPADKLMACAMVNSVEELGELACFVYDRPEFRELCRQGRTVVVAGAAFGCGSSRESAAEALKGCHVDAVIAPSFAYIFRRNAANSALPLIEIADPAFYAAVDTDAEGEVAIDYDAGEVSVEGSSWSFSMPKLETMLVASGGAVAAYKQRGSGMFDV